MSADISFLAAFIAGFLSFLSPCVLPLVPPYLGFLAGVSIEELSGATERPRLLRWRVLGVAAAFVLGFTTVFVTLGATASMLGQLLTRWMEVLSIVAGLAIIVMGLHFLGLFRIALLQRQARFHGAGLKAGPLSAYALGLAFAFGWTPCIGPVLATILTIAGSKQTVAEGVLLLTTYALGLGVPFMAAAFFAGPFFSLLKRWRAHLHRVEQLMGLILVATGIMVLTGTFQWLSFYLAQFE